MNHFLLQGFMYSLLSFWVCPFEDSIVSDRSFEITDPSSFQKDSSLDAKILARAKSYLNKPYVAHTLDQTIEEKLVVKRDGFDCTTLVETVLSEAIDWQNMEKQLKRMRYRNGAIDGYASRIHYFSEWIHQNTKNGLVTNITPSFIGKEKFPFSVSFMSRNPKYYKQLKDNPGLTKTIASLESNINHTVKLDYVKKQNLAKCSHQIKNGDIIAITTSKKGLDIAHLGFAIWEGKVLKMLHASTDEKKVIITKNSLGQYLNGIPSHTGVIVLRPNKQ
jgi:hypothetical protein